MTTETWQSMWWLYWRFWCQVLPNDAGTHLWLSEAKGVLLRSIESYRDWGVMARVQRLQEEFHALLPAQPVSISIYLTGGYVVRVGAFFNLMYLGDHDRAHCTR